MRKIVIKSKKIYRRRYKHACQLILSAVTVTSERQKPIVAIVQLEEIARRNNSYKVNNFQFLVAYEWLIDTYISKPPIRSSVSVIR